MTKPRKSENGHMYPYAKARFDPNYSCLVGVVYFQPMSGGGYQQSTYSLDLPEAEAFLVEFTQAVEQARLVRNTKGI